MTKRLDQGKLQPVDKKPLRPDEANDPIPPHRNIADAPLVDRPFDVHMPDENEDTRGPKAFPGGK